MIKYFNGCRILNDVEKQELKQVYESGGRFLRVYKNAKGLITVDVYTETDKKEPNYILAQLYGNITYVLFEIVGVTEDDYMEPLETIIKKYV